MDNDWVQSLSLTIFGYFCPRKNIPTVALVTLTARVSSLLFQAGVVPGAELIR
jgi:hypothetical protein